MIDETAAPGCYGSKDMTKGKELKATVPWHKSRHNGQYVKYGYGCKEKRLAIVSL